MEKPLTRQPLTSYEKVAILDRLIPLEEFLGAPGDWGYGTALGQLTIDIKNVKRRIIGDDSTLNHS